MRKGISLEKNKRTDLRKNAANSTIVVDIMRNVWDDDKKHQCLRLERKEARRETSEETELVENHHVGGRWQGVHG